MHKAYSELLENLKEGMGDIKSSGALGVESTPDVILHAIIQENLARYYEIVELNKLLWNLSDGVHGSIVMCTIGTESKVKIPMPRQEVIGKVTRQRDALIKKLEFVFGILSNVEKLFPINKILEDLKDEELLNSGDANE